MGVEGDAKKKGEEEETDVGEGATEDAADKEEEEEEAVEAGETI
jgi:hypothetical protein